MVITPIGASFPPCRDGPWLRSPSRSSGSAPVTSSPATGAALPPGLSVFGVDGSGRTGNDPPMTPKEARRRQQLEAQEKKRRQADKQKTKKARKPSAAGAS